MPMTEYDGNVEIITNIGTTPDERGLSTDEFKAKFDEGLKAFVTWFNDTHKTEFDAKADTTALNTHIGNTTDAHGINSKANKAQEAWITATLQNGWTGTLQYAKNELGIVTVKGTITAGTVTASTTIATLPSGYIPIGTAVPVLVMTASAPTIKDGMLLATSGNLATSSGAGLVGGTTYFINFNFYAG
jgi:hypothetical protein